MQHTQGTDYRRQFGELDQLLLRYQLLWQVQSFHHRSLPWQHSHPDLCQALLALSDEALAPLETDPVKLTDFLHPWLGDGGQRLLALTQLTPLPQRSLALPERFETGIGGRKWQQVQALAATLPDDGRTTLEWCAGKGHLGRLLAQADGREVMSLERSAALCQAGAAKIQGAKLPVRFIQADALAHSSAGWLPAAGQVVALHACGDLHTQLIRYWLNSDCQRLTLSPCCYHLIAAESYQPLSRSAAASSLRLSRQDLQRVVQKVVTGGQRTRRQSRIEVLWRLTFDEWQREQRGLDEYLPLPTFPKRLLAGRVEKFIAWAAVAKGLAAPRPFDERHWLQRGESRLRTTRLTELVSHFFCRPLELWLVLDQVLALKEQGARVRLGTFCDTATTPRNIVIDAEWANDAKHP